MPTGVWSWTVWFQSATVRWFVLDKQADELRLLFSGGGFAGAEQLEPVFRFVIEMDVFCPRDLPSLSSDEMKLKLRAT